MRRPGLHRHNSPRLLRGSGIEDGKYRIYEKYFTNPTVKEYAKFLKDEYGIGGYGYGQERQDHNGKGIRMEWLLRNLSAEERRKMIKRGCL